MLHFPYFDLYRKQVVKQPDLVLAMQLFSDLFTPEQRARNFDYYERITVRDSSLSACTEAVAAADAGHLRLAFDYAAEAALIDLHDLERNARDGLHVASLAGTWIAFVMGFGGMRDLGETLTFTPRLPDGADAPGVLDSPSRALPPRRGHDGHGEVLADARHTATIRIDAPRRGADGRSKEPVVRPIPPADGAAHRRCSHPDASRRTARPG